MQTLDKIKQNCCEMLARHTMIIKAGDIKSVFNGRCRCHSFNWPMCYILTEPLKFNLANPVIFHISISIYWLMLLEPKLITRQNITPVIT